MEVVKALRTIDWDAVDIDSKGNRVRLGRSVAADGWP